MQGASNSLCSACVGFEQDFRTDKQNLKKRRQKIKAEAEAAAQDQALRELTCIKSFGSFGLAVGIGTWSPQNHSKPKTKDALPSFEPASPMPPLQPAE